MTQSSEERVPEPPASPPTARIIPFERPQSELQRAVQQRAQEHLDAAAAKPKVSKVRRVVAFAVALIPVTIIFSGFLLAVHAVRVLSSLYAPPPAEQGEMPAATQQAPEPQEQQPGVVMLLPAAPPPPPQQEQQQRPEHPVQE